MYFVHSNAFGLEPIIFMSSHKADAHAEWLFTHRAYADTIVTVTFVQIKHITDFITTYQGATQT